MKHGYPAEAIGVIANFADDRLFTVMPCPPTAGHVRFVFHGTILERYGLKTLVEAVAQVRHRDKMFVRIIGVGDFSATLKRLLKDHALDDTVEFINDVYPHQQFSRCYQIVTLD